MKTKAATARLKIRAIWREYELEPQAQAEPAEPAEAYTDAD